MGIRYFAYPVHADRIDDARVNPYEYLGTDPSCPASGSDPERPEMLYLDRCWRYLQYLFASPPGIPTRPASALVAGSVVDTNRGWIPHVEVLSPAHVADAARDLTPVTDDEVRRCVRDVGWFSGGTEDDATAYVREYLGVAREFVTRMAGSGRGIIYLIG